MYVTRPLSQYRKDPESISLAPEGPNSGYLVIQDEESETYSCFGLCKNRYIDHLPCPQNKELSVVYVQSSGDSTYVSDDPVLFIPVLNQPLSANRYYGIKPHGKRKGEAFTCSKDEDKTNCCFCRCVKDVKPRPLDPNNTYQQFEIVPYKTLCSEAGYFYGRSVAPDGYPPYFIRRKGWSLYTRKLKHHELSEAPGVYSQLRARLPEFNFPISSKSSEAVIVGKWYCPFIFIKDGKIEEQVKKSAYYEMTLEQKWELVFNSQNDLNQGKNHVQVDVPVVTEEVFVGGEKSVWDEKHAVDGVVWFKRFGDNNSKGKEMSLLGLRVEIIERMKWEQERVGWIGGDHEKRERRISRVEEIAAGWREFGCYALVETFVLKRMDGSLVMTYGFRHTHQVKNKWE